MNHAFPLLSADSRTDVARLAPHSAFTDPTTPDDAPLRESIELRILVLYVTLFYLEVLLLNSLSVMTTSPSKLDIPIYTTFLYSFGDDTSSDI